MRSLRTDNAIGMFFSQVPCWAIIAVSASVFHTQGITDIDSAAQAAGALEPLVHTFPHAGTIAKTIFAVGIIGLGLLAVPVFAGSASYAVSEAFGCHTGLYLTVLRAPCFYGIIMAAMVVGVSLDFIGINSIRALIFASVLNGICSVPLIYLIVGIARNRFIMGDYATRGVLHGLLWITFLVVACSVALLFLSLVVR